MAELIVCGECGHTYAGDELLDEYQAKAWRALKWLPWRQRPRAVLHLLTARADDVSFCPRCLHDF